jgi:parallel beta-helix repeat protein
MVATAGNAALAQRNTQNLPGTFTERVDCNKKGSINATLGALSKVGKTRGVTILLSGTCNEDVLIQGFDRLTLMTTTSATINDPSGGTKITVDIEDSRSVTVQGFTINGGAEGVLCGASSVCYLTGNTVQSALDSGILVSAASTANLSANIVENNGRGLSANLNSSANSNNDTFQGNAGSGIAANQGYVATFTSIIQNNGSNGAAGINAINHSAIRLITSTVTGNGAAGVQVQGGSEGTFEETGVTQNALAGVIVKDLSYARFSTSNITGNLGGTDVSCRPQFPATRGALTDIGGGITNCVEP